MMKDDVFILGGYQTDFARNWAREKKHISAMMREAFEGSLAVMRVEPEDVQAAIVGNFAAEFYCKQGQLGAFCVDLDPSLKGIPTSRCEGACAAGGLAVLSAMAHIQAGWYDCICIIGVEQMKTVSPAQGGDYLGAAAWYEKESEGIEFPFPKLTWQGWKKMVQGKNSKRKKRLIGRGRMAGTNLGALKLPMLKSNKKKMTNLLYGPIKPRYLQ